MSAIEPLSFTDLPCELKLQVFSNLLPGTLSKCSRVCHEWYTLIQDQHLWKDVANHYELSTTQDKKYRDQIRLFYQITLKMSHSPTFYPPISYVFNTRNEALRHQFAKIIKAFGGLEKIESLPIYDETKLVKELNTAPIINHPAVMRNDFSGKTPKFFIWLHLDGDLPERIVKIFHLEIFTSCHKTWKMTRHVSGKGYYYKEKRTVLDDVVSSLAQTISSGIDLEGYSLI